MYQRLPLGPDGASTIEALQGELQQLGGRFSKLERQAIPRPEPPQYIAIEAELDRFVGSLGAVPRITDLLQRLMLSKQQVRPTICTPSKQQVTSTTCMPSKQQVTSTMPSSAEHRLCRSCLEVLM